MTISPEDPSYRQSFERLKEHYPYYSFDRRRYGSELENVTLLAVVAPTAAGKSTLIQETIALDDDIHLYESSTTRPREPRDGDDYRTDVPIAAFEQAVAERSLVNYFPHPSGHIYGTFVDGFSRPPVVIGAIATASIEQLFHVGFQDVRTVYTVTDADTYAQRIGLEGIDRPESRLHSHDIRKRLVESLRSLEFAEMNIDEDWMTAIQLSNEPGSLQRSARNLSRIAHDRTAESLSTPHTKELIEQMRMVASAAIARLDAVQ